MYFKCANDMVMSGYMYLHSCVYTCIYMLHTYMNTLHTYVHGYMHMCLHNYRNMLCLYILLWTVSSHSNRTSQTFVNFASITSGQYITSALTKNVLQTKACSLVSSCLDYANLLFVGVSDLEVKRLQRIQNSLARIVLCVPLWTCSSVLLHQLHWLPVEFRIRFKLECLT